MSIKINSGTSLQSPPFVFNGNDALGIFDTYTVGSGGTPDVSGIYKFGGIYGLYNAPYYVRTDGAYYIWHNFLSVNYVISSALGTLGNYYTNSQGFKVSGGYTPVGTYTGNVITTIPTTYLDIEATRTFWSNGKFQIIDAGTSVTIGDIGTHWSINDAGTATLPNLTSTTIGTTQLNSNYAYLDPTGISPTDAVEIGNAAAQHIRAGYESMGFINGITAEMLTIKTDINGPNFFGKGIINNIFGGQTMRWWDDGYLTVSNLSGATDTDQDHSKDCFQLDTTNGILYLNNTTTNNIRLSGLDGSAQVLSLLLGGISLTGVTGNQPQIQTTSSASSGQLASFDSSLSLQASGIATTAVPRVLFTQTADKTVSNTTTETSIVGTGVGGLTLSTNFFTVGRTIRIMISGVYSTVAVTGDTVTIKIKYGSTVIATKATTGLLIGATNNYWFAEALITCRSTGTTGTVQISGGVRYQVASSAVIEDELNNGAATTTINTTTSNLLDITVTHSAASASNSVKSLVSAFDVLN